MKAAFVLSRYLIAWPGIWFCRLLEVVFGKEITPNMVSFSRVHLAAVVGIYLLFGWFELAFWITLIHYYTDIVDGELARDNQKRLCGVGVTELGKIVDPLCDKPSLLLITGPLAVAFVSQLFGWWIMINGVVLLLLAVTGWELERRGKFKLVRGANAFGKAKYIGEFLITMALLYGLMEFGTIQDSLFSITITLTVIVATLGTASIAKHLVDNLARGSPP